MSQVEKPRVLLVDDNEPTCTLVAAILQREFEIEIAGDGAEAIERLKTKSYDAVILDLRLPVVDGFGVLEFVKSGNAENLGRVLILTASLSKGEVERVKGYDVCGLIAKPFEVETLLSAVKQCAGGDRKSFGAAFLSSGVILLLAEVFRQRWM